MWLAVFGCFLLYVLKSCVAGAGFVVSRGDRFKLRRLEFVFEDGTVDRLESVSEELHRKALFELAAQWRAGGEKVKKAHDDLALGLETAAGVVCM